MSFTPRARLVNPRLGTYFGIFASAFASLFMLLLIVEQLGASAQVVQALMFGGPLCLYVAIGLACGTRDPAEFFASGRRVPAVYAGSSMAITAMGATGIVCITGVLFLIGFDALFLVIGGLAGFVVMAVLLAPFFRKFGAFTVPTYLGRRCESRAVRIWAAALLSVPVLLMLTAELRVGTAAGMALSGLPASIVAAILGMTIALAVVAGGMRSLTWSGIAKLIAGLLAMMVPVATVAVLLTNLPIPQLTTGPLLRSLVRRELDQGLLLREPPPFTFALPGDVLTAMDKPFASAFGAVGPAAFVLATLTVMAGVAAAPWLITRVATVPSVYEARKSLGWATLLFGVIMLTLAAVAIFMRDFIIDFASSGGTPPDWFRQLQALGYVALDAAEGQLSVSGILVQRDGVLFSLPVAAEMPTVVLYLALAGAVAVALAAAGATAVTLGNILAEDIAAGTSWQPVSAGPRLALARGAIVVAIVAGVAIATLVPGDPLKQMLWALALAAAVSFPVVVLSIWWKGLNGFGAVAGMTAGFAVTVLALIAGETGLAPLSGILAGAFGLPAAFAAAIAVSGLTPAVSRHALDLVQDIRVPGGEILYDRETRLARQKQRQPS